MTNVTDINKYRIPETEYQADDRFNIGTIGMVTPMETQLSLVKHYAAESVIDGDISMASVTRLVNALEYFTHGVFPMFSVLADTAVRALTKDEKVKSVLVHLWDMESLKDMDKAVKGDIPLPKFAACLEACTFKLMQDEDDTYESWQKMFFEGNRIPEFECELLNQDNLKNTQVMKMVSNLKECVRVNGGFIRTSRSDDDKYALVIAFLPYTGAQGLQVNLMFNGVIK